MLIRLFLLLLLPIGWVQAQRTVIAGKFPYQRDVPYSIQIVSNQIIFKEEWGQISDTSDSKGFFHLNLSLKEPSLLRFAREESIELYLRPGDSLWIEMANGRNLHIEGTAALENRLHRRRYPSFVSSEISQNLELYSHYMDSLFQVWSSELADYHKESKDVGFESLFEARAIAGYLYSKVEIFKSLHKEAWEGQLMDQVRRQLQIELVDEVRDKDYIEALHNLLEMEVLQFMGQELAPSSLLTIKPLFSNLSKQNSPPGFEEMYTRHWRERLAKYPRLYRYFDLEEKAFQILKCNKAEQLVHASEALKQIKQTNEYPGFVKKMEEIYRKKVIQYQLRNLPDMEWRDTLGALVKLKAEDKINEHTMVVFWDAHTLEGITAYKKLQNGSGLRIHFKEPVTGFEYNINRQQLIWVQVGGEEHGWKKAIRSIPNKHNVLHCRIEKPQDIAALSPYLYNGQLPISFALGKDLNIESITNKPSLVEFHDSFELNVSPIIWRIKH